MTPTAPLSAERLEEIRRRAEKATPGEWHCHNKVGYVYAPDCVVANCGDFEDKELIPFNGERWHADAQFIAHAKQDIPALLAHVSHLEAQLAKLTAGASLEGVIEAHEECVLVRDKLARHYSAEMNRDYQAAEAAFLQTLRAAVAATHAEASLGWQPGGERCDACDNGVLSDWTYCPYCGAQSRSDGKPDDGR